MKIVDVHCHLESSRFKKDLDEVIERFREVGGEMIINSGTSPERNRDCLNLSRRFDIVKCSFGLYPTLVSEVSEECLRDELDWIEEHADECVAIGECGLDFSFEKSGDVELGVGSLAEIKERQKVLFEKQIDLAMKLGKPIVVHSRKGEAEAIEILAAKGIKKVVMHCFCGNRKLVKRGVELGFYFSVPPAIMRWNNFKMLVEEVPLDKLLTETDAPFLSAVVKERNEPKNVLVTIGEIARIKGLSEEEVAEKIFENCERVF